MTWPTSELNAFCLPAETLLKIMELVNVHMPNVLQFAMYARIDDYALSPAIAVYMKSIRQPVPDLKKFIFDYGTSVQKIQVFCPDDLTQRQIFDSLPFEGVTVTSSVSRVMVLSSITLPSASIRS